MTWMEQLSNLAGQWIYAGQIRPLWRLQVQARKREIIRFCDSAVLTRNHAVYVERQRIERGKKMAISQRSAARERTAGLKLESRMWFGSSRTMQHLTSFGLHDRQQVSDVKVAVKFPLLSLGQGSRLRFFRKVLHSPLITFSASKTEKIFCGVSRQLIRLRLDQACPYRRFRIRREQLRTHGEVSPSTLD